MENKALLWSPSGQPTQATQIFLQIYNLRCFGRRPSNLRFVPLALANRIFAWAWRMRRLRWLPRRGSKQSFVRHHLRFASEGLLVKVDLQPNKRPNKSKICSGKKICFGARACAIARACAPQSYTKLRFARHDEGHTWCICNLLKIRH